jgi:hypothetical protein
MKSLLARLPVPKITRLTLLTLLLTGLLAPAYGQDQPKDNAFHFGMTVQPALAWLKTDTKDYKNDGSVFRFSYAFVAEFNFAQRYAFATGININNRGGSLRHTPSDSVIVDSNWKLRYIDIPLTLKLKTNEIGYFTYYLQFGLSPGFNIRAIADNTTTINSGGGTKVESDPKQKISDHIGLMNLSMIIGLGAEYRFSGNTCFTGGLQFSNGFLDISSDNDLSVNSSYLGLAIGVLF